MKTFLSTYYVHYLWNFFSKYFLLPRNVFLIDGFEALYEGVTLRAVKLCLFSDDTCQSVDTATR